MPIKPFEFEFEFERERERERERMMEGWRNKKSWRERERETTEGLNKKHGGQQVKLQSQCISV